MRAISNRDGFESLHTSVLINRKTVSESLVDRLGETIVESQVHPD